jgi:hypothetical protein
MKRGQINALIGVALLGSVGALPAIDPWPARRSDTGRTKPWPQPFRDYGDRRRREHLARLSRPLVKVAKDARKAHRNATRAARQRKAARRNTP